FANSYIHQNVAHSATSVRLCVHLDGRTTTTSTTRTDADALRDLVERTLAASRVSPADPSWPGLTPPSPTAAAGTVDEATAHASPDERAARVAAFLAAVGELTGAGYCSTSYSSTVFANSAGQAVSGATTAAAMDGIAPTRTSAGMARLVSTRLAGLVGAEPTGHALPSGRVWGAIAANMSLLPGPGEGQGDGPGPRRGPGPGNGPGPGDGPGPSDGPGPGPGPGRADGDDAGAGASEV